MSTNVRDTIPIGRRLVVHEFLPRKLVVRGRDVIVYDMELQVMLVKQWGAQGWPRAEIEDLLLSPNPRLMR